jgi:hypothetical protein
MKRYPQSVLKTQGSTIGLIAQIDWLRDFLSDPESFESHSFTVDCVYSEINEKYDIV